MTTTPRDAIFGRLRAALPRDEAGERSARAAVNARIAAHAANLVPARGRLPPEERVALFSRMAEAVSATVRRLARLDEVAGAASAYMREHNLPQKLTAATHPVLDHAGFEHRPLLRVRRGAPEADDAVGMTVAAAAVAETGTLMLVSAADQPTMLSFLPETSIVVVAAEDIDGAYEDSWARLRAALGTPPRSVNFVTGPSRTGDIGQQLELGAHGPRRLLILIVDDLSAAA